ncbi:hypothetical protein BaOVIS_013480 [Babesia ovis]|uniref:GPI mannosyltransferase 2 n=1 Tax=Babesia ovis TaxID=5869 RepID=A0A9W5T9F4_BABOV|nr:hypothetical protein BaOVIS_013480 [Babesia ovis]
MTFRNTSQLRPQCLHKAVALACIIKAVFWIFTGFISWHSVTERPHMDQSIAKLTIEAHQEEKPSVTHLENTHTVTEKCAYKTQSELPYSFVMSLLDDRKPDGNLNRRFYGGMQFKLWKQIMPFISWDGERFLKIAIDDLFYWSEDYSAFMPFLPFLINISGKALRCMHLSIASWYGLDISKIEAPRALYMAISGLVLVNLAGIVAAGALYLVVWEIMYRRKLMLESAKYVPQSMTDDQTPMSMTPTYIERIAYLTVLFFCLGAPTIHCNSIYTENLFCMCTFVGVLLLLYAEDYRKIAKHSTSCSINIVVRIYMCEVCAVALFVIASALRSNGVLLLSPLFFYALRTCELFARLNLLYCYDLKRLQCRGKQDCGRISLMDVLRFVVHWSRALAYALTIISPMFIFQSYIYCLYCVKLTAEQLQTIGRYPSFIRMLMTSQGIKALRAILASKSTHARPWCANFPPNAYGFVQTKYWNVKLFWLIRDPANLHVFLYCWQTYLVTFLAIGWYWTFIKNLFNNLWQSLEKTTAGIGQQILKSVITVLSHPEMGIYLHMVATVFTFLFYAHTQVYQRQSLPIIPHAFCSAILAEPLCHVNYRSWKSMRNLTFRLKLVILMIVMNLGLCFMGGALFANFLGFT